MKKTGRISLYPAEIHSKIFELLGRGGIHQTENILFREIALRCQGQRRKHKYNNMERYPEKIHRLFNPTFPYEITLLEERVYHYIGAFLLFRNKLVNSCTGILPIGIVKQDVEVCLVICHM